MTTALTCVAVLALAYAFFAVFAWSNADSFIFRRYPATYADGPEALKIPATDGTPLSAVHLVAPGAQFTMLYLHGNAEDLGEIRPHLDAIHRHGYSVLAFDYRGYGTTAGVSSEAHTHADTTAVLHYLRDRLGIPPERVVLYGRSLGSGPAVELATREPVAGLVIDGGFMSAFRVVTRIPLLPGDRFCNLAKLARVRCPVLIIHGTHDRTVPFYHGERLFAAAREPKRSLWLEGAGHNDHCNDAPELYWRALEEFAGSLR